MVTIDTENRDFVRDMNSKALLMADHGKADDYMLRKNMLKRQSQTTQDIEMLKEQFNILNNKLDLLIDQLRNN